MSVTLIVEIIGLILGGGGLIGFAVGFATFKWQRMKARGEARQAELEATKVEQDTYQEIIGDLKEHNEVLRNINREINAEREELKQRVIDNEKKIREQDEKIKEQDEKIREQANELADFKKKLELVTMMVCGNTDCELRQKYILGLVGDNSFDAEEKRGKGKKS